MRTIAVIMLLSLVLLRPTLAAQTVPREELIARAVRARGFATVYGDVDADGTLLGLSAGEAVSTLFRDDTGLTPLERDAVLLILLARSRTSPSGHAELARLLESRIDRIHDWSLVAEVLSPSGPDGPVGEATVLIEVAERILAELRLERGPGPGYERAAVALARRVEASRPPRAEAGAAGATGAPGAAGATGRSADLALAETLREIARRSRDADVVAAARRAARRILEIEDVGADLGAN